MGCVYNFDLAFLEKLVWKSCLRITVDKLNYKKAFIKVIANVQSVLAVFAILTNYTSHS